jgi:hypothetical protein
MADDPDGRRPRGLMNLSRRDTDWFRPLWRRIAVVAFVGAWLLWELLYTHDQTWMLIVGGLLAYSVGIFLIRYDRGPKGPDGGSGK